MFKKTIFSIASAAALLGAFVAPAYAASTFHLVVPLSARTQAQEPADPIVVSLAGAMLPKATVNKAYSESLRPYLSVTGDAAFDPAAASWSLAEGTLPAGLSLDTTTGAVAGTPTTKTDSPTSFTVLTTYKGSDGRAVYTIEVGGVTLRASKISAGSLHSCAITDTGGLKCWGSNAYGQLGDGTVTNRLSPVDVVGMTSGIVAVSAGDGHTCAITSTGAAKCWGYNAQGQLGNYTTSQSNTPSQVFSLGSGVAQISAGYAHTCAVTSSGAVKCWGFGIYGQLGNGSTANSNVPVDVSTLGSNVATIAAGFYHVCARTTDGAVKCWGYNDYGQLGNNSRTNSSTPVSPVGLSGVTELAVGSDHSCVVASGLVKCWGRNVYGQLGDNSTTNRLTPIEVQSLGSEVVQLTAGSHFSCANLTSGIAKCWGDNQYGQLGDGTSTNRWLPVTVQGVGDSIEAIDGGNLHTCAKTSGGAVKCWGRNAEGQLGNNSTSNAVLTPSTVGGV